MDRFRRFAIYYLPDPAPWSDFAAGFLGWDAARGRALAHPQIADLPLPVSQITATPRRYGLHATIKPPFRLAQGTTGDRLLGAAAQLCRSLAPVALDGLHLARMGRFLALRALGDTGDLDRLAARIVADLDSFRAPPTADDLARRRAHPLSPAQETLLARWGYPHVMEHFRFHITLTGRLPEPALSQTHASLADRLAPLLPRPLQIGALCLTGEDESGHFHLIERLPLGP